MASLSEAGSILSVRLRNKRTASTLCESAFTFPHPFLLKLLFEPTVEMGVFVLVARAIHLTPHVIVFCSSTVTVFFFSASLLFFTSSFLSISPSLSLSLLPQHRHFYPRHFTRLIHMRINIDSRLEQGVENTVSFHIFFFLRIKKKEKKEERCQVSFFLPFFLLGSTQERTPPLWTGELFTFQQIKPTYFHCITSLFSPFLHDFLFCSC